MQLDLEAFILAGGKSRRMGKQKALMRWQGISFLRHAFNSLRSVTSKVGVIRKDLLPDAGPIGGLHTAALRSGPTCSWILITSCDMPGLNAESIQWWIQQAQPLIFSKDSEISAVFTQSASRGGAVSYGFPMLFHKSLTQKLEKNIHARQLSIQGLAKQIQSASILPRKDQSIQFQNLNTPEDFKNFVQWMH